VKLRNIIVLVLFVSLWVILFIRLYHVSIKSNFYYEKLAKQNTEKTYFIKPVRGEIVDRNGKLLAMNKLGFSISLAPRLKIDSSEFNTTINNLKNSFNDLNQTLIKKVYKKESSYYNHNYIKVIDFVRYEDILAVYPRLSMDDNIRIEINAKRFYPYGAYASHVVGYVGKSNFKENNASYITNAIGVAGKSSLEKYYNTALQGIPGSIVSKVTATNQEIEIVKRVPPIENRTLVLHLDAELQKMIYETFGEKAGAAVVMRPNGEILAAVSTPSYDPNMFTSGITSENWQSLQEDLDHPFTNKFLNGKYPPGSTIKMGMALSMNMAKPGILDTAENCPGSLKVGSHIFRDWAKNGHGVTDLRKSIKESVDVYYYKKSLAAGIIGISKGLKVFGFGEPTGVDLSGESSGLVPNPEWKQKRFKEAWYPGETVNTSIGQGYLLATPLQLARYTALIATSKLPTPTFASNIAGKKVIQYPKFINLPSKYLNQIRNGMYDVCNVSGGTASSVFNGVGVSVAGKTGTSQVVGIAKGERARMKEEQMEYYHRSHAWITTYAPYENPEIIVTVLVEHGGHGGTASGPIAADIYRWLVAHGYFTKKNNVSSNIIDTNVTKNH